jgi:hypothetical protein
MNPTIQGITSLAGRKPVKIIAALIVVLAIFSAGYYLSPSKTLTLTEHSIATSYYADVSAKGDMLRADGSGFEATSIGAVNSVKMFLLAGEEQAQSAEEYAERMVIYSATISLRVEKVDATLVALQALVSKYKGFTASVSTGGEQGYITIRVPQAVFYEAVVDVEALGKVERRDLRGEDVTERYVDLQAQLVNEQKQEARLQEILNLSKTVDDVMKVERELERVRGSIESLTGQIKYMTNRVELATITVNLNQQEAEPEEWQPKLNLSTPLKTGIQTVYSVTEGMVTMAVAVTPFALVGAVIYAVFRRLRPAKAPANQENLPKA